MARLARLKFEGGGGFYHITARVAARKREYPIQDAHSRRRLIGLLKLYSKVYCCRVIGFCVMGNHYHLIVLFEEPREVSTKELWKRASFIYSEEELKKWMSNKWRRFSQRIFDVSELMRNVQAAFARWFNWRHERRGRFWADRFKSTLLETEQQVLECLMYIDLNPVRAGLVQRPEEWEGSSIYYRAIQKDHWMGPLSLVVGIPGRVPALEDYRARLYYRGGVPTKGGQSKIAKRVIEGEEARGFKGKGIYQQKLRYFADGIVLGSADFVEEQIYRMRLFQFYTRRVNPIKREQGDFAILREQRKTAMLF